MSSVDFLRVPKVSSCFLSDVVMVHPSHGLSFLRGIPQFQAPFKLVSSWTNPSEKYEESNWKSSPFCGVKKKWNHHLVKLYRSILLRLVNHGLPLLETTKYFFGPLTNKCVQRCVTSKPSVHHSLQQNKRIVKEPTKVYTPEVKHSPLQLVVWKRSFPIWAQ